ncbi:hypothetical protein [Streptomyces spirodelae]|uniref:Uncharacterized protein n=1 Tax=Streptomyces spirodelae TaxID=2812904 RepID=A0ABS3X1Q4_9ACTN|nr:hypothetical protein [Streptomyces spirodelae]MBO8189286.1 hypothetical protein [Streptomyces spirodelae]
MKWTITALMLLAGALPIAALVSLRNSFAERHSALRAKRAREEEIKSDPTLPSEEKERLIREELPSESTGYDVLFTKERIELAVLDLTVPRFTRPVVMTALGILSGTGAGLLSLWASP